MRVRRIKHLAVGIRDAVICGRRRNYDVIGFNEYKLGLDGFVGSVTVTAVRRHGVMLVGEEIFPLIIEITL